MDNKSKLKSLEVFSKKINKPIKLLAGNGMIEYGELAPAGVSMSSWLNKGWTNGADWQNHGWSNGSNWINEGWTNGLSWSNGGWSNGSSWSNSGWSDSGGCFITTACVEHMGLTDNCEQLELLRMFRDELVESDPKFREQVLEYYKNAPKIVEKILSSDDKDSILDGLYNELVMTCVDFLKQNKTEEAKEHYTKVYKKLANQFIPE